MLQTVISASVKDTDTENQLLIQRIKEYKKKHGISMSFIILKALEQYENTYIKGTND